MGPLKEPYTRKEITSLFIENPREEIPGRNPQSIASDPWSGNPEIIQGNPVFLSHPWIPEVPKEVPMNGALYNKEILPTTKRQAHRRIFGSPKKENEGKRCRDISGQITIIPTMRTHNLHFLVVNTHTFKDENLYFSWFWGPRVNLN